MAAARDPYKLYPHDRLLGWTIVPLIPRFVSPNAITVLRFVCLPAVGWLLATERYEIGVPFFLFVAFTDALDGTLARLRKRITPWGTFYDPVADKLLIGIALACVVGRAVPVPLVIAIIAVEMTIALFGWSRRKRGFAVSANVFGKAKMFFQVVGLSLVLAGLWFDAPVLEDASVWVFLLALALAVVSLFTYGL